MKKITPLFVLIHLSFSLLGQQDARYSEDSSFEQIDTRAEEKLKTLLSQYEFPKDYEKKLRLKITEFEYRKKEAQQEAPENERPRRIDSLKGDFEIWRSLQKQTIKAALDLWFKSKSRFELDNNFKKDFVAYHFYIGIQNPDALIYKRIKTYSEKKSLVDVIRTMAKNETERIVGLSSELSKLDSTAVNFGARQLYDFLKYTALKNLKNRQPLIIKKETDVYKIMVLNAAKEKQAELEDEELAKNNNLLIEKALDVGVTKSVADNIIVLIEVRKNALAALKTSSKESEGISSLFENTDAKTKTEIKQEFAKNLAEIIDLKQFAALFGSEFLKNKDEKTAEKILATQTKYNLNAGQVKKLEKIASLYYFNREIQTAYYSFDKKLRKQELSHLRHRFEKDYKALMSSFGIAIDVENKVDGRSF